MSLLPDKLPEWVGELGGWGVVLLIVRWMMIRIDTLIAASENTMRAVLDEFRAFREQEREEHEALRSSQSEILSRLRGRTTTGD